MNRHAPLLKWFSIVALALLAGCASVLSKQVLEDSETKVVFTDLKTNTDNYLEKSVVLGGTIVDVGNDASGSWMIVLQRPLDYRLEPQLNDQTEGRFLVQSDQILEESVFAKGRRITVAGRVSGSETRSLDQITYEYPRLKLREYHLWPEGYQRSNPQIHLGIGVFGRF